ncbi:MAG: hypothetical protein Q8Q28_09175 [Pseudomonadota bacterium]|nr:hypothetical protein [Pseudomonadota bacterium]
MLQRTFTLSVLTGALALSIGLALAADPASTPQPAQVYGSQLMTPQERAAHRAKMRTAKTAEEQAQVRAEEHARLKERADQKGLAMPDSPPAVGGGMGPVGGRGGGMGQGGGRNR